MKSFHQLSRPSRDALTILARRYPLGMSTGELMGELSDSEAPPTSILAMLLDTGRVHREPSGLLNVDLAVLRQIRSGESDHDGMLPEVPRCGCGMPAVLGQDKCPTCQSRGSRHRPSWNRNGYTRPGQAKHRAPTPPPPAPRESQTCPKPYKAMYRSEREALLFLAAEALVTQWPYRCPCGAWHVHTPNGGTLSRWQVRMLDALRVDRDASTDRADYYEAPPRPAPSYRTSRATA